MTVSPVDHSPNTMKQEAAIRFFSPITPKSVDQLVKALDNLSGMQVQKVRLLISTLGGSSHAAISAYNYMKSLPLEVDTYNFGTVATAGIILYCAGQRRYTTPYTEFSFRGLYYPGGEDRVAQIIRQKTNLPEEVIERGFILRPEEAVECGLVHEIKEKMIEGEMPLEAICHDDDAPSAQLDVTRTPIVAATENDHWHFAPDLSF
jgi:ATP-dependent protease ClpP protease subunit